MYKPTADEEFEAQLNLTYRQDMESQRRVQQARENAKYRAIADASEDWATKGWGAGPAARYAGQN